MEQVISEPIVSQAKGMSLDALIQAFDQHGAFELINGEIIRVPPSTEEHNDIATLLFIALHNYCVESGVGKAVIEGTFILSDIPNWVKGSRVPDVLFFRAEKIAAYHAENPDKRKPYILVPDLAVEIASPTERSADVPAKVALYLNDGVQIVWVIEPLKQQVSVFRADTIQPITLQATDSLDGAEVIPGFSMPVAALVA